MKKINVFVGILFLLSACTGTVVTPALTPTKTPKPFPAIQYFTATSTVTPASTSTSTATPIPSPTWIVQGPGNITVPILLYHHISVSPINSRYYVPPELFEQEMKVLHDWGYTTITVKMLVQAITIGRALPPRPILITFDDGHMDNYTSAFPIMQKYGFTGVLYIVYNFLDTQDYLNREEVLEMYKAGWEVGSHTLNHYDLTKLTPEQLHREVFDSKKKLENILGIDVLTIAYPFGAVNRSVISYAQAAGYIAAMGAEGYTDNQGEWNLYNLQRVEIKSTENAKTFTRFLTWQGQTSNSYP